MHLITFGKHGLSNYSFRTVCDISYQVIYSSLLINKWHPAYADHQWQSYNWKQILREASESRCFTWEVIPLVGKWGSDRDKERKWIQCLNLGGDLWEIVRNMCLRVIPSWGKKLKYLSTSSHLLLIAGYFQGIIFMVFMACFKSEPSIFQRPENAFRQKVASTCCRRLWGHMGMVCAKGIHEVSTASATFVIIL